MASEANNPLHFALFPFLAQGHMNRFMDIARMLAQRGLIASIFITQQNADRFKTVLDRAIASGLQIRLALLRLPSVEVGLPEGCDNLDLLSSIGMTMKFFEGYGMLHQPAEELFEKLNPRACCIISDMCIPWTLEIANKFHVPRVSYSGFSTFFLTCLDKVWDSNVVDTLESTHSEYFAVPGLPDHVKFTANELFMARVWKNSSGDMQGRAAEADKASYGAIVNSFDEMEPAYVNEYNKVKRGKAWCIGPVSICNESELDKAQRGNKSAIDEHECFKWLGSWPQGYVVYACMGSLCNLKPAQMMELALGLEASNKPFVWAMRGGKYMEEMEKLMGEDGFEERVKGRGMLIRGWAPQLLILSHPAIGGFLTHCGWNSTLEAITAGLPLITWPLFGDHFGNEKLVEQVLKIGVSVREDVPEIWVQEEIIMIHVEREGVKRAIGRVMDQGEEGEERRKRVRKLSEWAKRAVEDGGSSHTNLSNFIQDITQMASNHK